LCFPWAINYSKPGYMMRQILSNNKFPRLILKKAIILILIIASSVLDLKAQEESPNWDNILYFSNKVSWGRNDARRSSAEFQTRYDRNFSSLEQWHLEYITSFLISKKVEISPDLRYTKKPTRHEFRPGLSLIYKQLKPKSQFIHQVKYQYDIKTDGIENTHGFRYAMFYNHVFDKNWIGSFIAGALFEFGPDWSGLLGIRSGPAVAYLFNDQHTINFGYFYGLFADKQGDYTHAGILSLQLIINIRKSFRYQPAKYINF
jgi:uncharacterized protein DUF2490